jgi:hypothetical protein
MQKRQFDAQYFTEIGGRKVVLFDQNYYLEQNIYVPIQYFSTVKIEFLSKPLVDEIRSSVQGTRHIDGQDREIMQNAQIRQDTIRNYPAARIDDSPFFSQEMKDSLDRKNHSTRMAFPSVQAGMTREMMQAIIDQYDNPKIFEVLSDVPIINLRQLSAIEAGLTDIETIMDGTFRVVNEDGTNAVNSQGYAIEFEDMDEKAGQRWERRGGQRLRYPTGATDPETGRSIAGEPIYRATGKGIKEQFRAFYLDLEDRFQDYDFRERVVSPITSTNLGRQSFAQLSNHAKFTQTTDNAMHGEDTPTRGGSHVSTNELRESGRITNAFDGIRTSTTATIGSGLGSGNKFSANPTGAPVQPGVAIDGDNPKSTSTMDDQQAVPRHTKRKGPTMGSNDPAKGGKNPNELPDK